MLKYLLLAAAGYVVYKLFTNDLKRKQQAMETERRRDQERMATAGSMVKDPVCGAYVSVDSSVRVRDGQDVVHFCSYECRDEYLRRIGVTPPSGEDAGHA